MANLLQYERHLPLIPYPKYTYRHYGECALELPFENCFGRNRVIFTLNCHIITVKIINRTGGTYHKFRAFAADKYVRKMVACRNLFILSNATPVRFICFYVRPFYCIYNRNCASRTTPNIAALLFHLHEI